MIWEAQCGACCFCADLRVLPPPRPPPAPGSPAAAPPPVAVDTAPAAAAPHPAAAAVATPGGPGASDPAPPTAGKIGSSLAAAAAAPLPPVSLSESEVDSPAGDAGPAAAPAPPPPLPIPPATTPSSSSVAVGTAQRRQLTTVLPACSLAPPGPPPATQHRWGIAALGPRASSTGDGRLPLSPRPPAPAPAKHALPPHGGTPPRESASFPAGMRPALPHLGSPPRVHALLLIGRLRAGRATTPPPAWTHPHSPSTLQTL